MSVLAHNLPLLLLLAAIALLIVAVALVRFAARGASRTLRGIDCNGGPLQSFRGGLRWPLPAGLGATNTPPVLVGLDLFDWGVRIGARWPVLTPFVPTWSARYEEIQVAEYVRRGTSMSKRRSEGVRLRAAVTGTPLIFWTSGAGILLESLEGRGVATVRSVTPMRLWTNE